MITKNSVVTLQNLIMKNHDLLSQTLNLRYLAIVMQEEKAKTKARGIYWTILSIFSH